METWLQIIANEGLLCRLTNNLAQVHGVIYTYICQLLPDSEIISFVDRITF